MDNVLSGSDLTRVYRNPIQPSGCFSSTLSMMVFIYAINIFLYILEILCVLCLDNKGAIYVSLTILVGFGNLIWYILQSSHT